MKNIRKLIETYIKMRMERVEPPEMSTSQFFGGKNGGADQLDPIEVPNVAASNAGSIYGGDWDWVGNDATNPYFIGNQSSGVYEVLRRFLDEVFDIDLGPIENFDPDSVSTRFERHLGPNGEWVFTFETDYGDITMGFNHEHRMFHPIDGLIVVNDTDGLGNVQIANAVDSWLDWYTGRIISHNNMALYRGYVLDVLGMSLVFQNGQWVPNVLPMGDFMGDLARQDLLPEWLKYSWQDLPDDYSWRVGMTTRPPWSESMPGLEITVINDVGNQVGPGLYISPYTDRFELAGGEGISFRDFNPWSRHIPNWRNIPMADNLVQGSGFIFNQGIKALNKNVVDDSVATRILRKMWRNLIL